MIPCNEGGAGCDSDPPKSMSAGLSVDKGSGVVQLTNTDDHSSNNNISNNGNIDQCDEVTKAAVTVVIQNDEKDVSELTSAVEKIHLEEAEKGEEETKPSSTTQPAALSSATRIPTIPPILQQAAKWISEAHQILVLSGAGVSVAAGIPDFRSPGTGLYDNLQKYNLPYPEAIFELDFYQRINPHPFLSLAKELWPSGRKYSPTWTHAFLALLAQKQRLLRNYTQNIDGLEFLANIPNEKLVECHGHFRTSSCIRCGKSADPSQVEHTILHTTDIPTCAYCKKGYVKPDIVFFGESLPQRFHAVYKKDIQKTDLCLVLGTSLQVAPVSLLPEMVSCRKRILFNRELVGDFRNSSDINNNHHGNQNSSYQDLFCAGDCDDTIQLVAHALGWYEELKQCYENARSSTSPQKQPKQQQSNKK